MSSAASELLPDPATPVTHVSTPFGARYLVLVLVDVQPPPRSTSTSCSTSTGASSKGLDELSLRLGSRRRWDEIRGSAAGHYTASPRPLQAVPTVLRLLRRHGTGSSHDSNLADRAPRPCMPSNPDSSTPSRNLPVLVVSCLSVSAWHRGRTGCSSHRHGCCSRDRRGVRGTGR